jgi:predicted AlkP superfamily pyrophosphatase or phosphodiesterase
MKILFLLFCALLSMSTLAREFDTVLMVSIDALHPAALSEKVSPTLQRLMVPGRYTLEGLSVSPPQTLIAHAAMMTGLTPVQSGQQNNDWKPGMAQVAQETLFDFAKQRGYQTAFFYAKQKLGYLLSAAVDVHALARDDGVDQARAFFLQPGRRFVFLHLSGLEDAGADSGWLSPGYLDELTHIDATLSPLLDAVRHRGSYLVVVTSDHAGHERQHGTVHPEDFRLPVIMASDQPVPALGPGAWPITELKALVQGALDTAVR